MNLFQVIIILVIIFILGVLSQRRTIYLERILFLIITFVGIFFVLFPQSASRIANLVGIGRGADLVFYLFIIFSWLWFTSATEKMRVMNRKLTEVVRTIALMNAQMGKAKVHKKE